MKNFILSEQLKNDVLNCIAHATHNNFNYLQVNALVNAIQNLKESKEELPEVSHD